MSTKKSKIAPDGVAKFILIDGEDFDVQAEANLFTEIDVEAHATLDDDHQIEMVYVYELKAAYKRTYVERVY